MKMEKKLGFAAPIKEPLSYQHLKEAAQCPSLGPRSEQFSQEKE